MKPSKKPSVLSYLDLHSFLRDYYSYRKSLNKGFSYETWSQELNFNKSRSFLRMIVIGKKKASKLFIEAFVKQSFTEAREIQYFQFLVCYAYAETTEEKQAFSQKMIQILRSDTQQTVISDSSGWISSPALPRLLTLLSFKDLDPVAPTYARLMNLPLEQIETMLGMLRELGLAESSIDEKRAVKWKSLSERFKVKDNHGNLDLMKFHRESLQEAIGAFALPKKLRRYKSLLLSMSETELEEFYTHMDNFAAEQFTRYSGDLYDGRRVFQINLNVHPVTKATDEALS